MKFPLLRRALGLGAFAALSAAPAEAQSISTLYHLFSWYQEHEGGEITQWWPRHCEADGPSFSGSCGVAGLPRRAPPGTRTA